MNSSANVDVMEKVTEAALKAGAVYPEAVAEYLKDSLVAEDTLAGPVVMVRNGMGVEPLDAVMARLQVTENVGVLFHGGKLNMQTLDHGLYRAIRQHAPALVGLRPNRKGRP